MRIFAGQRTAGSAQRAQRTTTLRAWFFCCLLSAVCCPAMHAQLAVSPTQGTETGGDLVTVSGLSCTDCTGAIIRFGSTPSPKVTGAGIGVAQVITPPHGIGTVDVTTDDGTISKAFTYVQAGTYVASNFER